MKNTRKIGLAAIAAAIALTMTALSVTGCPTDGGGNNPTPNPGAKTLTGIEVTTFPTKTEYAIGEPLNLAGLVVSAVYSDGSKAAVTGYTTDAAASFDSSTAGTKTITVTYNAKKATFTVTTAKKQPLLLRLILRVKL